MDCIIEMIWAWSMPAEQNVKRYFRVPGADVTALRRAKAGR